MARPHSRLRAAVLTTCLFVAATTAGCGSSDSAPNTGGTSGSGGSGPSNETGGAGGVDGEPPADVAGEYTVSLVSAENNCANVDWKAGNTTTGVMFTIKQNGTKLTAETGGDAAVYFVLLTGSNQFAGDIHGNAFTLIDHGPTVSQSGSCTYTLDAIVEGTIDGDTITGTLTYSPVLSSDPECAQYACAAVQDYTGVRPSSG